MSGPPGTDRCPLAIGGKPLLLAGIVVALAVGAVGAVAVLFGTALRNADWIEWDR